jgi:hypothetical protein
MTDIHAVTPIYKPDGLRMKPTFPKLIEVHVNRASPDAGHDYAATLDQYYGGDAGDPVGYGPDPGGAIADLREQVLDIKLSGPELAALEGWLAYCLSLRPEYEHSGFKRCIAEVLDIFE